MTSTHPTAHSSIDQAIDALKSNKPDVAETLCREHLNLHPDSVEHLRFLGHALMQQRRFAEAETQFKLAIELAPDFPRLSEDLGSALAQQRKLDEAIPFFQRAVQLDPEMASAHKKLGRALAAVGRNTEADAAFETFFDKNPDVGAVAVGADHMRAGREEDAIKCFRQALKDSPDNIDAMRFLAAVYLKQEIKLRDAEALLQRATQLAPDFAMAWLDLGHAYTKRAKRMDAIEAFTRATDLEPNNGVAWEKLASVTAAAGYPERAAEAFQKAITVSPQAAGFHMGYGHALKTLGDQAASLRAYREAIRLKPDFGEVYWSMANLKVFKFEDAEVEAMEHQLENSELEETTEVHFRFALGKAYEDRKDYDKAWSYYHSGNERQRPLVKYDPVENSVEKDAIRSYFTPDMLQKAEGNGYADEGPIFILGLGRSGSTLVEQILASHSQVEGTEELSVLGNLSDSLSHFRSDKHRFPTTLDTMRPLDWRALGLEYLDDAKRYRLTDKPIFTDKLPNNFPFIGLIHLILPNAKIINARRHPIDTCLGNYKQLFGRGQNHTYDIFELADYYKEYCQMMDHWHEVLPGKVLDVHYEETVTDLEGQVARILEHCGLPFEEACVRFHETERAVKTASSEQVRQPIYKGGMGKWRKYESHLGEWMEELSPIIDDLPDVVKNAGL
ncbi:MAG: tetratricopeptide repeat protein [Gammaproteobacteria bacterium]|jgi:tetratricopeptide (TPR) repeat protein|nr:tetratricopeptide repeat protein [Gammaproteobacteria bacterium]